MIAGVLLSCLTDVPAPTRSSWARKGQPPGVWTMTSRPSTTGASQGGLFFICWRPGFACLQTPAIKTCTTWFDLFFYYCTTLYIWKLLFSNCWWYRYRYITYFRSGVSATPAQLRVQRLPDDLLRQPAGERGRAAAAVGWGPRWQTLWRSCSSSLVEPREALGKILALVRFFLITAEGFCKILAEVICFGSEFSSQYVPAPVMLVHTSEHNFFNVQ